MPPARVATAVFAAVSLIVIVRTLDGPTTASVQSMRIEPEIQLDVEPRSPGVGRHLKAYTPHRRKGGEKARVVLFTAIFGQAAPAFFPYFLKSAEFSGADYIVLGGGTYLPHLPPNVRHIPMDWKDMINLLSEKLFAGNKLPGIRYAKPYKTIDTKPLFGYLFRELITEYDFWGHIDNDMILGNITEFLDPLLDHYDIITPNQQDCEDKDCDRTWGPFTIYRNVPRITELFRTGDYGLYTTFNSGTTFFFDEWGGSKRNYYDRSMTNIINKQLKPLRIRHYSGGIPVGWDGECVKSDDPRCSECVLSTETGENLLTWNRSATGTFEYPFYPVILCHFQVGKKETSRKITDLALIDSEALLSAPVLVWTFKKGFHLPE